MIVDVPLSGGYDYRIEIGAGLRHQLGDALQSVRRSQHAVVVSQPGIAQRWLGDVTCALEAAAFQVDTVLYPAGERHKHLGMVEKLYSQLYAIEPPLDRKALLVAFGGGVVGDMVGFVAATYLRGLDYVQVPTTLLAMVDSSVGGKTGVDFRDGKNLIGAFHQPRHAVIDPELLRTLPRRELRSGLAEVVKYGVIRDPELLVLLDTEARALLRGRLDCLDTLIARSCEIKADVVVADEREETGTRAILNFGHTIGHALESATHYRRYKHGEAVAIGMISAAAVGEVVGVTPSEVATTLRRLLPALGLPTALPDDISDDTLATMTLRDKKALSGTARFVLAECLGKVRLVHVSREEVCAGLRRHREWDTVS